MKKMKPPNFRRVSRKLEEKNDFRIEPDGCGKCIHHKENYQNTCWDDAFTCKKYDYICGKYFVCDSLFLKKKKKKTLDKMEEKEIAEKKRFWKELF
ncbi:MAG: hypothetical protein ACTSWX_09260 [Promethearchaeota archaeon]